jgi:hypothetical protein
MAEFGTLISTSPLVQAQGSKCNYGCDYDQLPEIIAYTKQRFPDKPYCVVKNWTWLEITAANGELDGTGGASGDVNSSVLYIGEIIADEAHRPRLGPMMRTSALCEFHRDCIFVTKNTAYILCGSGNRTKVSAGLMTNSSQSRRF